MEKKKRFWENGEVQYLKDHYMIESYSNIAKRLGRTKTAVKKKCESLELTKRNQQAKVGDVINGWKIIEIYDRFTGKQNIKCARVESTINNNKAEYRLTKLTQGQVGWPDRRRPDVSRKNTVHNLTNSRLYSIYNGMKRRCYNKNQPSYKNYGGRGIKICDEWLSNFKTFYDWAMSNGYDDTLSIDRRDIDGNYCPENCEWSTIYKQANNKTTNCKVVAWDETKTLSEWTLDKRCVTTASSIKYRIDNGWKPEIAISTPGNKIKDSFRKYKQLYLFIKSKYPHIIEEFLDQNK